MDVTGHFIRRFILLHLPPPPPVYHPPIYFIMTKLSVGVEYTQSDRNMKSMSKG